ncbi:hypothetical protein LMG28614_07282 [Paraburkholderia ultramafica]|uniref:Phospholipase C n=1 Tax=Paraburkholderia ultramafica TaxID=1544867 RepID=A0A6S7BRS1_9BURK|nr:alkaline phosphatase family protein [Paraburkholderia ultramafica]CAB3810472.1 hypothetical protein LMG28614_07282 [Paraburkholderia ultramafica]
MANIEHFVVLMLENRSFDHIFGLRQGVNGIKDSQGNPVLVNVDDGGREVPIQGGAPFSIPTKHGRGPFHNVVDVNEQLFGDKEAQGQAKGSGFVSSYREALGQDTRGDFTDQDVDVVMKVFSPTDLPAINALADHFVLCEQWFCEVPGPTHPNRLYVHAGTSEGFAHNVFKRPFDSLTIYELVERAGKTWAVYDFDLNEVKNFTRLANKMENFRRFKPRFAQDIEKGELPNYSFIVPRFNSTHYAPQNDQHAPADVRWGEQLIADVYDALRAHDETWGKCALIVTYDEHGGFPDHEIPPGASNPDDIDSPRPDDNGGNHHPPEFKFDRLGLRVPALIVSPWVERGMVCKDKLQHTSILKTVREAFGIEKSLSKREEEATSFSHLFIETTVRTDAPQKLPRPKMTQLAPATHHANPGNHMPDDLQTEMLDGLLQATRLSHPEDEDTPVETPPTQAEVSALAHQRWARHEKWVKS